jgi:hypothetical protein
MQKSRTHVTRKRSRPIAPRRVRRTRPALLPTITQLIADVELIAPRGCSASVLLKLVTRDDGHRYYAWWAMVGRYDHDALAISYRYTGEDTIRFDVPEGMRLCAESLQPHLTAYLRNAGTEPPDTPIIRD